MEDLQDFLEHHGIKGQKWGVRRYQNSDGSLTSKGKSHYSTKFKDKKIEGSNHGSKNINYKKEAQKINDEANYYRALKNRKDAKDQWDEANHTGKRVAKNLFNKTVDKGAGTFLTAASSTLAKQAAAAAVTSLTAVGAAIAITGKK